MKLIPLSRGLFAQVDDDDYHWLVQWNWLALKNRNTYYAIRFINSRSIYMHRAIMNAPKGITVDHRDRIGLNNQRSNLRLATGSQNAYNRPAPV